MPATSAERRRQPRARRKEAHTLRLVCDANLTFPSEVTAQLVDVSESGIGVQLRRPVRIGTSVQISGQPLPDTNLPIAKVPARVTWCTTGTDGTVRAGLGLENPADRAAFGWKPPASAATVPPAELLQDYYEVLQINSKAHPDTIQKVFRLLAQRYHPDNAETGDAEMFKLLVEAHRTLSDPEKRTAYDVQLQLHRQIRWKLFAKPQDARGVEAEKRKRHGILMMLYTKRLHDPDQPAVTLHEMEEILGCPKEHLQFSLWYLKESGFVTRTDNGRFAVTVKGVDHAESNPHNFMPEDRLLPSASSV